MTEKEKKEMEYIAYDWLNENEFPINDNYEIEYFMSIISLSFINSFISLSNIPVSLLALNIFMNVLIFSPTPMFFYQMSCRSKDKLMI